MTSSLQAGVATAIISPAVGTRLIGFAARTAPAAWVRDQLEATALVLDDGAGRLAMVACDLCFIHPTLLRRVRALVAEMAGIAPDRLLVCCSHTHSGPVTYVPPGGPAVEEAYVAHLPHVLAGAVAAASRRLQPATLAAGRSTAAIGVNRRVPDAHGRVHMGEYEPGVVDPMVSVLCIDGPGRLPLATLVNYACHPVILGPDSLAVSADFVGAMRRAVTEATGAPCLFVQGACADINPRGRDQIATEALVETLGTALARAVFAARRAAAPIEGTPLSARQRALVLPLATSWDPPGATDPQAALSMLYRGDRQGPPLTAETVTAVMNERFPWSAELVAAEGAGRVGITVEVGVLRAGEIAIAGIAGEPFVETGLAIKAASRVAHTIVAGYTNGCPGYLPPRAAYPQGGYEVDEAYRWYRLPTPPEPGGAERVVEQALEMLV